MQTLRENLERSRQMKEAMILTLDSFVERINQLQKNVLPINDSTAYIQMKQQSKCLYWAVV